jgi:hypothetical protein
MSNKIQNPNVLKKEVNSDQKKTNIKQSVTNVERRLAVHRLRFTILSPFGAFEISWFRDYLFWHLTFNWNLGFDICHSNHFISIFGPF